MQGIPAVSAVNPSVSVIESGGFHDVVRTAYFSDAVHEIIILDRIIPVNPASDFMTVRSIVAEPEYTSGHFIQIVFCQLDGFRAVRGFLSQLLLCFPEFLRGNVESQILRRRGCLIGCFRRELFAQFPVGHEFRQKNCFACSIAMMGYLLMYCLSFISGCVGSPLIRHHGNLYSQPVSFIMLSERFQLFFRAFRCPALLNLDGFIENPPFFDSKQIGFGCCIRY